MQWASQRLKSGRPVHNWQGRYREFVSYRKVIEPFHMAGSEDGSVRVWELRSGQAVRVINSPEKAPVSALLVLDRPSALASGQGRHGATSSSDSGLSLMTAPDI